MLIAKRFDVPADLPALRDRETLAQVLVSFGTRLVREASDPTVIADSGWRSQR